MYAQNKATRKMPPKGLKNTDNELNINAIPRYIGLRVYLKITF